MTSMDQVSATRVLGELDNGSEKACSNKDFMTRVFDGTINQQLSEDARITTDVVSNVQLGDVHLCSVPLRMGRDCYRIANAPRSWSTKALRLLF